MLRADTSSRSRTALIILLALFCLTFFCLQKAAAAPLTPQEERGRQVYVNGASPAGIPILAYFGKDLLEVPGESATCASCHGYDGLGRTESGVIPSNITWPRIMKSYGHIHPDGLEHGPFTVESLKSYMEDGIYPGGRQGDPSMPVYRIDARDLDDLVAYLKRLDSYLDPGINDSRIRIGTLLPAGGPSAELGEVMQRTIEAYFSDINTRGGIYGRSLTLTTDRPRTTAEMSRFLRSVAPEQEVFALVNSFTPAMETELGNLIEEQHLPLIAPFSLFPIEDQLLHRYRFYLYAGLREQILVLPRHATNSLPLKNPRIQIIYPEREGLAGMLATAEELFQSKGWKNISRTGYASGGVIPAAALERLRDGGSDLLLFLGGESEAGTLLKALGDGGCATTLLMPGVPAGKAIYSIPPSCKDKVWLSFPSLPDDRKEWGLSEFRAMAARQQLAVTHPTAQLAAYSSAKILVEGLRRAGRNLSRERLLEALEGIFEFDTGLTPLVSYNKNRRIGAPGAHIVGVDPLQAGSNGFFIPRGWISAQ